MKFFYFLVEWINKNGNFLGCDCLWNEYFLIFQKLCMMYGVYVLFFLFMYIDFKIFLIVFWYGLINS